MKEMKGGAYRNEQVRDLSGVLVPISAIASLALCNITGSAVQDHDGEEEGEEVWDRGVEAADEAPHHHSSPVDSVVNLAGKTVPARSEESAAVLAADVGGVVDCLPWDLGEGLAELKGALFHLSEAVLLGVARVPDPVAEDEHEEHGAVGEGGEAVVFGVVVNKVEGAVAVGHWDTSHVPENQHITPLLVRHVPGGNNEFLTLGAGVGVEPVGEHEEADIWGDVSIGLVLLAGSGDGDKVENVPWETDLKEHLEVTDTDSWVELGAHPEIVNEGSGHSVSNTTVLCAKVGNKGDADTRENRDGKQRSKLVNDGVEWEDSGNVKDGKDDIGEVKG